MSRIQSLLDPEVVKQMQVIAAQVDGSQPARPTSTDEIDIDPQSEALIEASCFDCHTDILVEPSVPTEAEGKTRRFVCAECLKARLQAMDAQRNVEVIRRARTVKHQPRITDHVDHPVVVRTTTKENDMIDLDTMSSNDLADLMREAMRVLAGRKMAEAKPVVEAQRAEEEVAFKEAVAVEQEARRSYFDEGFTFMKVEVPDLDLRDVSNVNEIVSGKVRSAYNKMRHRNGEPLLTYPDKDGILPAEGTPATIGVIIGEHQRFKALAQGEVLAMPTDPVVALVEAQRTSMASVLEPEPVQVIAAVVEPEAPAVDRTIAALAALFDESIEEATARLG